MVKRQRLGRPVQDDGLHRRLVEPCGQDGHRGKHSIGGGVEPLQNVCTLFLTVGVVQVHARVTFFGEHGLHLLGGVDAVVEDEGLGAFGFFLVRIEQLLLHEEVAVEALGRAHGVVAVDAHLQRAQVHVVAVGVGLGQEALVTKLPMLSPTISSV